MSARDAAALIVSLGAMAGAGYFLLRKFQPAPSVDGSSSPWSLGLNWSELLPQSLVYPNYDPSPEFADGSSDGSTYNPQPELTDGSLDTGGDQPPGDAGPGGLLDTVSNATEGLLVSIGLKSGWQATAAKPENAHYVAALHAAEQKYGMPDNLLVRLAYQESHFRPDIISGQTISSAGAVGIMQIVPKWHPDVNAFDPIASINYAAKYLASLYGQFGSWKLALQAYNWGPGNLKKYLSGKIAAMPTETQNYSSQILADLGLSGGIAV